MDAIIAALEALSDKGKPLPDKATPPTAAPVEVPRPAPKPAPKVEAPKPQRVQAGALQGMFEDGNTLLRAVIASEVLGPPASLRENHFWNRQPNEPLT
jgi:hypothetical protein